MQASAPSNELHIAGPHQPVGLLRDLLEARIDAVPAGGSIDWVTYYFRDRRLAQALLRAQRRGVRVSVALSRHTRTAHANADVVALLAGPGGLGAGLELISLPGLPAWVGRGLRPRLHEKIYCFSHPRPVAFVGSFNPSGDVPESRPDIIEEIGDHDRGWNMLVGLAEPALVAGLLAHVRRLHTQPPGLWHRFRAQANAVLQAGDTSVCFWPRLKAHPVLARLDALSGKARVRIAASHLSAGHAVEAMMRLARRGVQLEIIAEPTQRRVPTATERRLHEAGIRFVRWGGAGAVPMHLKFVLAEDGDDRWLAFGSFNWTVPSMRMNHEIAVFSGNRQLFDALAACWDELKRTQEAESCRPSPNIPQDAYP